MFRYFSRSLLFLFPLLLSAVAGCNSKSDTAPKTIGQSTDTILATVAGNPIPLSEFQAFSKFIPDGMKKGKTRLEKERQVLESLIDKRLMLLEASALSLEEDTALKGKLSYFSKIRLLELYTKQEIADKVTISDEEMEAHYRATHRDRALRFSGIMLKSLEEAQQILQQVGNGTNFMELAKDHSLHNESAEQGGDIGGYKLKDKVHPTIATAIFSLAIGEVSEPILLNFQGQPHYAVFQVTDEMPVPMAATQRKIREELFGKKRATRYQVLLDSLIE